MSSVNPLTKEILLKIVYAGPGLGGKTTTLRYIHQTARPEHRGKMVSLATPVDRTLYFDFLPIRLSKVGGYTLRLQLFTVPGQVHYNATRKLVLTGADGVVLVVDSQVSRMDANVESLENLVENLSDRQIAFDQYPIIFQYNKRDLENIVTIDELEKELNPDGQRRYIETCALTGDGVYRGLELITKEVLKDLKRRDIISQKSQSTSQQLEQQIAFRRESQGLSQSFETLNEMTLGATPVSVENPELTTEIKKPAGGLLASEDVPSEKPELPFAEVIDRSALARKTDPDPQGALGLGEAADRLPFNSRNSDEVDEKLAPSDNAPSAPEVGLAAPNGASAASNGALAVPKEDRKSVTEQLVSPKASGGIESPGGSTTEAAKSERPTLPAEPASPGQVSSKTMEQALASEPAPNALRSISIADVKPVLETGPTSGIPTLLAEPTAPLSSHPPGLGSNAPSTGKIDRSTRPAPPLRRPEIGGTPETGSDSGFTFLPLWPAEDRLRIAPIERALAEQRDRDAIAAIWQELERRVAAIGDGLPAQSPANILSILGLDGGRYLKIARLARAAAAGESLAHESILRAYLFLLQAAEHSNE